MRKAVVRKSLAIVLLLALALGTAPLPHCACVACADRGPDAQAARAEGGCPRCRAERAAAALRAVRDASPYAPVASTSGCACGHQPVVAVAAAPAPHEVMLPLAVAAADVSLAGAGDAAMAGQAPTGEDDRAPSRSRFIVDRALRL